MVIANDIGLLELDNPFVFSESVKQINLPLVDYQPINARISGWGSISNNNTVIMPNTLQTILLPVISNEECQDIIAWSETEIHANELCTGNGDIGGIGTCGGDSGGGLVQLVNIIFAI